MPESSFSTESCFVLFFFATKQAFEGIGNYVRKARNGTENGNDTLVFARFGSIPHGAIRIGLPYFASLQIQCS